MPAIPLWLLAIINLAIKIGSPYLLKQIEKWAKVLPDEIRVIIAELIKNLKDPMVSNEIAKKDAIKKVKQCVGVACPPETK